MGDKKKLSWRDKLLRKGMKVDSSLANSVSVPAVIPPEQDIYSEVRHIMSQVPRANAAERTVNKIVDKASPTIEKMLNSSLGKMSLERQVKVANQWLRMVGVASFRAQFLLGFQSDIVVKVEEMGKESTFAYYWNCPDFQKFWLKIGQSEEDLRTMIGL